MNNILVKPIITEKMTSQGEEMGRYGFIVRPTASKIEIKNAVEEIYGVSVIRVNTMRYAGKSKSRQTRSAVTKGKTNSYKKAIITVADGEIIDFYSNI